MMGFLLLHVEVYVYEIVYEKNFHFQSHFNKMYFRCQYTESTYIYNYIMNFSKFA